MSIATTLYNDIIKPRKRFILYGFLIVVFSAASYFAYISIVPRKAFYESFGADISNDNDRKDHAVILGFFADWCPHCKTATPVWNRFVGAPPNVMKEKPYGNYLLSAETVDCSDGTDSRIQKYGVNGYPTVMIVKDGVPVKYEGKITADTLESFVVNTLGAEKK